jgi:hypothetical protein
MLVELAYPRRRAEHWLGGRWLKIVPGLLVADVVFGLFFFSAFTGFWPPLPQYSLFVLLTAALVLLARRLPLDWARKGTRPMRWPRFYRLVTALAALTCRVVFWVLPNALAFQAAPILVIMLGSAVVLGTMWFLRSHDWRTVTPMHRFALAAGALAPFVAFAFFQELDRSRPDDTTGMALVGLVSLICLICLWRSIKKRA